MTSTFLQASRTADVSLMSPTAMSIESRSRSNVELTRRANTRTLRPSFTNRSTSRPPMNPAAPVTKLKRSEGTALNSLLATHHSPLIARPHQHRRNIRRKAPP